MHVSKQRQLGFSLIELMIGLVAGIVVVGAVSSFAVTTLRASNQNIQSGRLTQDLRTAMTLVTRELRRSGYDAAAVTRLGTGTELSGFTTMQAPPYGPAGCLSYQYNRSGDQFRAIRANNGSLEMATSTAPITDCTGGTWNAISDSNVVNITGFAPSETREPFASVVSTKVVGSDTEAMAGCGMVRRVSISITGSLARDASLSRTIRDDVRVRADTLRFVSKTFSGVGSDVPDATQECSLRNECLAVYGMKDPDC